MTTVAVGKLGQIAVDVQRKCWIAVGKVMVLVNGAAESAGNLAIVGESCRYHLRMSTGNGVPSLERQACLDKGNEGKKSDDWLK